MTTGVTHRLLRSTESSSRARFPVRGSTVCSRPVMNSSRLRQPEGTAELETVLPVLITPGL